jgi:hypothetical protein
LKIISKVTTFLLGINSNSQHAGVFAPARYRVVKIACSFFEVVLETTNYIIVYPDSVLSLEVIGLHPAV